MQSRRDLFQAHRLMTQRASVALLSGEPDVPDQPMRRLNIAAFSGALVGVIAAALVAVLTLVGVGGSGAARQQNVIILDAQTGTAYVFCDGGRLCPTLNYASARLAVGSATVSQETVSQSSLSHYRSGPLIGIAGLPQPLPAASPLLRLPWSVCEQQQSSGLVTTLVAGLRTGGTPLGSSALVVNLPATTGGGVVPSGYWMLWNGYRLRIDPAMLATVLGRTPQTPPQVPAAWLSAVPEGGAFTPPPIPGAGQPAARSQVGSAVIGQLYYVLGQGTPERYYVMLRDGLAQITQTQYELLNSKAGAPASQSLRPSQVGNVLTAFDPNNGLPAQLPDVKQPAAGPLCLVYSALGGGGSLAAGTFLESSSLPAGALPAAGLAGVQFVFQPGAGALVGAEPAAGRSAGAVNYYLVTGGFRYPLVPHGYGSQAGVTWQAIAGMLGYQAGQAVLVAPEMLSLLPVGPPLDPLQARQRYQASAG